MCIFFLKINQHVWSIENCFIFFIVFLHRADVQKNILKIYKQICRLYLSIYVFIYKHRHTDVRFYEKNFEFLSFVSKREETNDNSKHFYLKIDVLLMFLPQKVIIFSIKYSMDQSYNISHKRRHAPFYVFTCEKSHDGPILRFSFITHIHTHVVLSEWCMYQRKFRVCMCAYKTEWHMKKYENNSLHTHTDHHQ